MQKYASKDKQHYRSILFFLVVMLIAYLPATSFMFFLKNDAFTGYFPPKFFMSESIKFGYLPLWNPYINFGIPQYGDISSGFWNPITWIFASTTGYNAYSFTVEVFLYVMLGGVGFYKLTEAFDLQPSVQKISALAYMCSGFMVGHLQHFNWLAGAAFFPWCFWSYHLLLTRNSFKVAIQTALLFYLLIASAHPGITIGTVYFFSAYFLYYTISAIHKDRFLHTIQKIGTSHLWFLFFLLLFSVGLIIGYADILPFFTRGDKVSLSASLGNPTTFQSWISIVLPFVTVKNDVFFHTDIAMRNSYFGIILCIMLFVALFNNKNAVQLFLWIVGLLFLLLSSGGVFKTFAFNYLPFLGYVRLNGEFRIFTISCFILLSAMELDKYITNKNTSKVSLKSFFILLGVFIGGMTIFGCLTSIFNRTGFIFHFQQISIQQGISSKLKCLIDTIGFYDTFWIQGIIQMVLLFFMYVCFKNRNWHELVKVVAVDLIIASLLNMPFTGVGRASVADVQTVLNNSPKGIPRPLLKPIVQNDTASTEVNRMVGNWSLYNKQIGSTSRVLYPIILKNTNEYFNRIEQSTYNNQVCTNKPFVFLIDSAASLIELIDYSPQKIRIRINSKKINSLILQQNNYPHWYYSVCNREYPVSLYGINFMEAPVPKGASEITLLFEPKWVVFGMAFSALAILICIVVLFVLYNKKAT
jgi:hypothetical protein